MSYVFISYSTQNQTEADLLRTFLNRNGLLTWMAPYDIPTGSDYTTEIPLAIKECSCFIVLLSNSAQSSTWVTKEVERAIHFGRIIIPIKIEIMETNEKFSFMLGNIQCITINQIDNSQEELLNLIARIDNIMGLTDKQKANNIEKMQIQKEKKIDDVEKIFFNLIHELYDVVFEYKKAFRLAIQEDMDRFTYSLQNICHQLNTISEKYWESEHHNIAIKAKEIFSQYYIYVTSSDKFFKQLKKRYGKKSNEYALEAERDFDKLIETVKLFLE